MPVPRAQPGKKYHFAGILFCPSCKFNTSSVH